MNDDDDRTRAIFTAVIKAFSPVYIFHPKERYFPLRFPTYVKGCSLMKRPDVAPGARPGPPEVLVAFPTLKLEDLTDPSIDAALDITRGPTRSIYLKIEDPNVAYGTPPCTGAGSAATANDADADTGDGAVHYVYSTLVQVDHVRYVDVLFNLLYGYNCMAGDDHQFDSEYVIVRVRLGSDLLPVPVLAPTRTPVRDVPLPTMELMGMWTSRHGGGGWYTKDQLRMWNITHPVSYVALGSHANYVAPGIQRRLWGFGNDLCASATDSSCARAAIFAPPAIQITKPGDAGFPGKDSAEYRYMAYVGQTGVGNGQLMAWNPRYLNTIQTPPQKASDDTSQFVKKEVPGIGNMTFWGVVALLVLVTIVQIIVFTRNVKSIGQATWQQTLIVLFSFLAGVFATYANMLK